MKSRLAAFLRYFIGKKKPFNVRQYRDLDAYELRMNREFIALQRNIEKNFLLAILQIRKEIIEELKGDIDAGRQRHNVSKTR